MGSARTWGQEGFSIQRRESVGMNFLKSLLCRFGVGRARAASFLLIFLLVSIRSVLAQDPPAAPVWIWAASPANPPETVFFRQKFRLPASFTSARLAITADNSYKVTINETKKPVAQGNDWTTIQETDVTRYLKPGENVFAIECLNSGGAGGLIYRLTVRTGERQTAEVVSSAEVRSNRRVPPNWTLMSLDDSKWPRSAVIAPANGGVWGQLYLPIQSDPARLVRLWDIRAGGKANGTINEISSKGIVLDATGIGMQTFADVAVVAGVEFEAPHFGMVLDQEPARPGPRIVALARPPRAARRQHRLDLYDGPPRRRIRPLRRPH